MRRLQALPHDLYLALALFYEQASKLLHHGDKELLSDRHYRQILSWCEGAISTDRNDIYSVLSFAVLFNVHEQKRHFVAAMTELDQLNEALDQHPEVEAAWHVRLEQIRQMKEKQRTPSLENFERVLQITNVQKVFQTNNPEEIQQFLAGLLAKKFDDLKKIDVNRSQIKADEEHFGDDPNDNRKIFYRKMRSSLSHKFIAMAMTSGDAHSQPIVKHDRTGTESK